MAIHSDNSVANDFYRDGAGCLSRPPGIEGGDKHGAVMSKPITLKFTEDEAEIIIDALETDLEGYVDSIKDARANGQRADVATFSEAAARITAVRDKIRAVVGE